MVGIENGSGGRRRRRRRKKIRRKGVKRDENEGKEEAIKAKRRMRGKRAGEGGTNNGCRGTV